MRAAFITRYGRDALNVGTLPEPVLERGNVLLKVHYVALNPVDIKTRAGKIRSVRPTPPSPSDPLVLGYDCSGTITAVGPGVPADWRVGDAVMGVAVRGALCPTTTLHWEQLAHKPPSMSFADAACLVTAGMTALQMLNEVDAFSGNVHRLLVTAGAGGVGHYALQLAKRVAKVDTVITTASASKSDFVRRCGADVVIDYQAHKSFVKALGGNLCDAALDCTGETARCKAAVRANGSVVSILGIPDAAMLRAVTEAYHMAPLPCMCCISCVLSALNMNCCSSVRVRNIVTLPIGSQLESLALTCVREGIVPTVDRIFKLEDAVAAFNDVEEGHVTGKVLVEVFASDRT